MRAKTFLKKCKDLQIFEEQTLRSVNQQFDKYLDELDRLGLVLDIDLLWYFRGGELSFSRIEFKNGYTCAISLQIREKNDPKHNIDLEAITLIQPISKIHWPIFWIGIIFSKISLKDLEGFLDDLETTVKEVIEQGYEKVLGELKQKDNNLLG